MVLPASFSSVNDALVVSGIFLKVLLDVLAMSEILVSMMSMFKCSMLHTDSHSIIVHGHNNGPGAFAYLRDGYFHSSPAGSERVRSPADLQLQQRKKEQYM